MAAAKTRLPQNIQDELAKLEAAFEVDDNDVEAFQMNINRGRKSAPGQAKPVPIQLSVGNFMKFKEYVHKNCSAKMDPANSTNPPTPAGGGGFVAQKKSPIAGEAQEGGKRRMSTTGLPSNKRLQAIRQSIGNVGPIANVPLYKPGEVAKAAPVADKYDHGNALASATAKDRRNSQPYTRQSFAGRQIKCGIKSTPIGENLKYEGIATKPRVQSDATKVIEEYRWMNTPLDKRAGEMNARVEYMEDLLEKYALENARRKEGEPELEVAPVGRPCVSTVIVIGRVCCETTGKLNERSVMLEGSLRTSHGQRVMLMLADCDDVQLFPGQIIAAVGMSGNMGQEFNARQIIPGLPVPRMVIPRPKAHQWLQEYNKAPVTMSCAAGPFCSSDSVDFAPLKALGDQIIANGTDVLFLMGPLLDCNNNLVKSGDITTPDGKFMGFQDIYFEIILPILDSLCRAAPRCQIYYVPSTSELLHLSPMPQPPLNLKDTPLVSMTVLQYAFLFYRF